MSFYDLAKKCRTVRRYDESIEVGRDRLINWVECARVASSASNLQPLRYKVVSDPDECAEVFPNLAWAGALKDWDGPAEGQRPRGYIIILSQDAGPFTPVDLGIASQNIMLAAADEGFGCCMFKSFKKGSLAKAIGVDLESVNIELVMSFGAPAEKVVLEEVEPKDGSTTYWRDEDSVHHVPKRRLEDILF